MTDKPFEDLGTHVPRVLGALIRRYGHFDQCEDAVQEALLAATLQWPEEGRPVDPGAWLIRVASRRLVDRRRSDAARERRETADFDSTPAHAREVLSPEVGHSPGRAQPARLALKPAYDDDTLMVWLMCCHPALTRPSQVALTLRAVGGLTTSEIAAAYLVPEATMAQRVSRAKATIVRAGARFELPDEGQVDERLGTVLEVLYLVFNEGYLASSGPELVRRDLSAEAVRLARELHRLRPAHAETAGLLALMLLTEARRLARVSNGDLVPLDEQDRSLWKRVDVEAGIDLVERTLAVSDGLGPYQLQAAIAAVHAEADSWPETDWPQVLALYDLLRVVAPGPVVEMNRAVAVGEVHGPSAGLAVLESIPETALSGHHRADAVRAFLLRRSGDLDGARESYRRAIKHTRSLPERRHLQRRLLALDPPDGSAPPDSPPIDRSGVGGTQG